MQTNKQIIQEIRNEQKRMATEQLEIAMKLSVHMNKQDAFNDRIIDLLETNPATKKKGVIEDLENVKDRVLQLETNNKITAGKVSIGLFILTSLGGFVLKLLGFFDK
jgi:hypothetical protein